MGTPMDGTTPQMASLWNEIINAAAGQGADIETAMKSGDYRGILQAAAKDNRFATDEGGAMLEHAGSQVGIPVEDIFGAPDQGMDPMATPDGMGQYENGGEDFMPPPMQDGIEDDDSEMTQERPPGMMKLGGPTQAQQEVYPYYENEEGYGYDVPEGTDGPYEYDKSGGATFNAPVVGSKKLPMADEDDPNGFQAAVGQASDETRRIKHDPAYMAPFKKNEGRGNATVSQNSSSSGGVSISDFNFSGKGAEKIRQNHTKILNDVQGPDGDQWTLDEFVTAWENSPEMSGIADPKAVARAIKAGHVKKQTP